MAAQIGFTQAFDISYGDRGGPLMDGGDGRPDWKEAAGQTFKDGDPVYLDSGGLIALVVAGSNKIDDMLGFAKNDASGVTNTPVQVRVVNDGDIVAMNLKPSGGGSQATAQAQLGDLVNFDLDTSVSGVNALVANPTSAARTKPWGTIQHLYTAANGYAGSSEVLADLNGHVVVKLNRYLFQ